VRYYRVLLPRGPTWAREEEGELRLLSGEPFSASPLTSETVPLAGATLLPPAAPSKIVAVGLNYKDHARERGRSVPQEPLLFLKPPTALVGPGEPIRLPPGVGRVDHEAELGIVIGRRVRGLRSPEEAEDAIFGALCANDVTARDLQDKDVQFTRAKGFDTFCPVGPAIVTGLPLSDLKVECRVNGAVRQSSRTRELIFSPEYLVFFVSRVMTLLPGDIISTGTPAGIGPLEDGDVVEVEVEGCGILKNPVVAETSPGRI
jgi:2-keto-4-pentenoate hydratase/2-oxohepta-3-ene-1,7-dioic acid hydratase in catechol pathway